MKLSLRVVALLWCLLLTWTASTCDCAPLQTTITGRGGSTSCVGDMVMYTCTAPAVAHVWKIPSLNFSQAISRANDAFPPPGDPASQFSIITTADGGGPNPITTALSVTSFAGLNGANISCGDSSFVSDEVQETTAMVFEPPSAPGLSADPGEDMMSIDFTITPSNLSDCVVNYIISTTSSDGTVFEDIIVAAANITEPTLVKNEPGYSVCTATYGFVITPVTGSGTGSVTGVGDGVSGVGRITDLDDTPTGIEWSAPSGVPETCFPQYIIFLTANSTVTLTVDDTMASFAALNASGFPYCVSQEITVTPIVAVTNTPFTNSSATMQLVINNPDLVAVIPAIVVIPTGSLNATVSWEDDVQSTNRIVGIGQRSSISGCVNVRNVTGETSTSVEFECDDSGLVVMPPCVQYFDGECSSIPFFAPVEKVNCPTPQTGSGASIGPIIGGVVGGIVAVILVIVVIIIVIVIVKKKGDSGDSTDHAKPKITYHSAGATAGSPQTAVALEEHAPGALYADPKAIEHETAASTGDEYALLNTKTKAKKKNAQAPPEPAPADLGDMYSVPDKTKKQKIQNEGLVYADIDVPQRLPPRNHGSQKQQQPQPDEEPVTYATVTSPM